MRVDHFDFDLPPEQIAQQAVEPRDQARLMICRLDSGARTHTRFDTLPERLAPGDLLVINDTRVRRARLTGRRLPGGGGVEVLLLAPRRSDCRPASGPRDQGPAAATDAAVQVWDCLARPGRRLKPGTELVFGDGMLTGQVLGEGRHGRRQVRLTSASGRSLAAVLDELGRLPLPPYIQTPLADEDRYQTVYAREAGSVAAPTAGLHFTARTFDHLAARNISVGRLTLHVGPGTFRPVRTEKVDEHPMEAEYVEVPPQLIGQVEAARRRGGRVVAVGTTVTRALEAAAAGGVLTPFSGWTDLFIYPGFRFQVVDALLTNFHLPRSTLLMLVCALAGRDRVLDAYREAVVLGYRFYSLGDATLWIGEGDGR
ncbi:MAG: tRNA preQ1(34) S-adenosylmethionine ribosyltransferase-isomerase QueA [Thermaerobacterales bacterium]